MVPWKEPIERRVLDAGGMCGVVIVSSVASGDGGEDESARGRYVIGDGMNPMVDEFRHSSYHR